MRRKKDFPTWMERVRGICRSELQKTLNEIPMHSEELAKEYYSDGCSPREYFESELLEERADIPGEIVTISDILLVKR